MINTQNRTLDRLRESRPNIDGTIRYMAVHRLDGVMKVWGRALTLIH